MNLIFGRFKRLWLAPEVSGDVFRVSGLSLGRFLMISNNNTAN